MTAPSLYQLAAQSVRLQGQILDVLVRIDDRLAETKHRTTVAVDVPPIDVPPAEIDMTGLAEAIAAAIPPAAAAVTPAPVEPSAAAVPSAVPVRIQKQIAEDFEREYRRNAEGHGETAVEFTSGSYRARFEQRRGFWVNTAIEPT